MQQIDNQNRVQDNGCVNLPFDERYVNFSFDGKSSLQAAGWQD